MSYATIEKYFQGRLATFQLSEAKNGFNMEGDSENVDKKFVIENPSMNLNIGDTLATRFFPRRVFVVRVAFKLSESGSIFEYRTAQAKFENIIADLHSASNYRSHSIRLVMFDTAKVAKQGDYVVGEMSFNVEDSLNYV